MSESNDDLFVTVEHMREANFCVRGMKQWFALHKLDFAKMIRDGGISAKTLEQTNDVMAQKVIAIAREEAEGER